LVEASDRISREPGVVNEPCAEKTSQAGSRRRLSVRVTDYDRGRWFRNEMVSGPFRRMRHHDHWFDPEDTGTKMRDTFEFSTRVPLLDSLVLAPHLRRFVVARNEFIRRVAEGDDWRRYLGGPAPPVPAQ
jgi:hypothetical protein